MITRKTAKRQVEAAAIRQEAHVYKTIKEFFDQNTSFTQEEWDEVTMSERYLNLIKVNPELQDYYDRLAVSRIAINTLIDATIDAERRSNDKNIKDAEARRIQREKYARELREEAERCQKSIEEKIAEATDHLKNSRYKEALNAIRE